jgi:hypothetical protein
VSVPAPSPVPPPAPINGRGLLAVLLAAGVVALVWQAFGLFGFGTDAHLIRVLAALGAALVCALVAVSRARGTVRLFALLAALGGAAAAWWFVPGYNGAPSLAHAHEECAQIEAQLAVPLFEAPERGRAVRRACEAVKPHFPQLASATEERGREWEAAAHRALAEKWAALAGDDCAGVRDLLARQKEIDPTGRAGTDERLGWIKRARAASDGALNAVPLGDWAGFDRTAAKRKELVDTFGGLRPFVVVGEDGWVNRSVRAALDAEPNARADRWAALEAQLLALNATQEEDARFATARLALFARAHETAQRAATKHIEAREYDAAFALARAHAVRWNATASLFGEEETKKLDKLRDACAVLARLAEIAGPPDEPAPPPREREVAPLPRERF